MSESTVKEQNLNLSQNVIENAIRLALVALLIYWCFLIFQPFVMLLLWAIIIAVAIYPLFLKFESKLGGRKKLALILFAVIAVSILVVPTLMLAVSMIDSAQLLAESLQAGTLQIPPPPSKVAEWPLIGDALHSTWHAASTNLIATIEQYAPQLKTAGQWLVSTAASGGVTILQFILSILIATLLIANAEAAQRFIYRLSTRLIGEQGHAFSDLAGATMRSVAQGVLGVAFIQAVLAGVGLMVIGVPGAGLWALLVLILAVVQLPPILILGPIIIYVFSSSETLPAILFMIWAIMVSASDTVLKPLLLGRGLDIPMLVILIGSIGGMMLSGIIGLFIGAVVLAVGYKLFTAWLEKGEVSIKD